MNQQLINDFRDSKVVIDFSKEGDLAVLMSIFRLTVGEKTNFYFSENNYYFVVKGFGIIFGTNTCPKGKEIVSTKDFKIN